MAMDVYLLRAAASLFESFCSLPGVRRLVPGVEWLSIAEWLHSAWLARSTMTVAGGWMPRTQAARQTYGTAAAGANAATPANVRAALKSRGPPSNIGWVFPVT